MSLKTDKKASCKYDTSDKSFEAMGYAFQGRGATYHSKDLGILQNDDYRYYVRCMEEHGVTNTSSGLIRFKVDVPPPQMSDFQPSGTIHYNNIIISLKTNKKASCKYDIRDKDYKEMRYRFDEIDTTRHSKDLGLLSNDKYKYYVRCSDEFDNTNDKSGIIQFEVVVPPPQMSNFKPSGTIDFRNVVISLNTDKKAYCKYDTGDKTYEEMKYTFEDAATAATSHRKDLGLLSDGSHTYYVRCSDEFENINDKSGKLAFKILIPNACSKVFEGTGDPKNKLDIVFIGDNFTSPTTFQNIIKGFSDSFLSFEPFKTYSQKLNVWQVNRFPDIECKAELFTFADGTHKINRCNHILARDLASDCPNDQIIIVVQGSSTESNNGLSNAIINSGIATISSQDSIEMLLHQFGHSFGGLKTHEGDPNCQTYKKCLMCKPLPGYTYGSPTTTGSPCDCLGIITKLLEEYHDKPSL